MKCEQDYSVGKECSAMLHPLPHFLWLLKCRDPRHCEYSRTCDQHSVALAKTSVAVATLLLDFTQTSAPHGISLLISSPKLPDVNVIVNAGSLTWSHLALLSYHLL